MALLKSQKNNEKSLKDYLHFRRSLRPKQYIYVSKIPITEDNRIRTSQVGNYRELVLPLYFGWEIVIRHQKDWRQHVMKPFKTYWQYMTVVTFFIVVISSLFLFIHSQLGKAATYTFSQTSWLGGETANTASHSSDRTNWTEYISKDSNIAAGTEIVLTEGITTLTETSDTDFNAGAASNTRVFDSGDSSYVGLGTTENNTTYSSPYTTGNRPESVIYDPTNDAVWTANYFIKTITKHSASDPSSTNTYSTPGYAQGITYDSTNDAVWVANFSTDNVSKFSASDGSLIGTYTVGNAPKGITYDETNDAVWVTNSSDSTVTKLNASDGSLAGTYNVDTGPDGIIYESYSDCVWVANYTYGSVTRLNASDGSLNGSYAGTPYTYASDVSYDSVNHLIWVTRGTNKITSIDIDTNAYATYDTTYSADAATYDPQTESIWMTHSSTYVITKFSTVNHTETAIFTGLDYLAHDITYDSTNNAIWFTTINGNSPPGYLYKIDLFSYSSSGTFTSQIIDTTANSSFGNISWNSTEPASTGITMKVRSDSNADMSGAIDWATCNEVTSGSDISANNCVSDGDRYIQYQATLSTADTSATPQLSDISIEYNTYSNGSLLSSAYDTESTANVMANIAWTESGTGDIKFQIRTAPDNAGSPDWANGSGWCGPSSCGATTGDTDYAASYFETSGADVYSSQSDTSGDEWFQYRVWLVSADNISTPTLSDVTVTYVVNAPPEFEASPTSSQDSSGIVYINYSIRDTDASSGSGVVTPSFQYSLDNGSNWNNITTGLSTNATSTSASATSTKDVDESTYTEYTAAWTPSEQISSYSTTAKIKVIVDDGEAANNNASSTSAAFTLDAAPPSASDPAIWVIATSTPATLHLSATDDSSLDMCISLDNTESNCVSYSADSTIDISDDPDTIYVKFRDAYGNITSASAVTPNTPTNMIIRDLSNVDSSEYRLFIAWSVISISDSDFAAYRIWRSIDGSNYTLLDSITSDKTINYYLDTSVSGDSTYYYKVSAEDQNGNVSYFSSVVSDTANGQGGTDASPPTITGVNVDPINTQSAVVTWNTDELSDSTVGYSTTAGNYETTAGVASMVTSHSVTLTGLTPGDDYYFRVISKDPDNNSTTDNNDGESYNFKTLSGPAISSVSASSVQNSSAVITWNTDIAGDSTVYYSTNSDMSGAISETDSNSGTEHSITLDGLTVGTKYYFYVESGVAMDNNGGDYYYFITTSDSIGPVISNVDANFISDSSAVIDWDTDELASSKVAYGTLSGTYDNSTSTTGYTTAHRVSVAGLDNSTIYYYVVVSKDQSNNITTSTEDSFTTSEYLSTETEVTERVQEARDAVICSGGGGGGSSNGKDAIAPQISDIKVDASQNDVAVVTWKTNEPAISIVDYGIASSDSYSEIDNNTIFNLATNHSISLPDLLPDVTYKYKVLAIDSSGNLTQSEEGEFLTGSFLPNNDTGADNGEGTASEDNFLSTIQKAASYISRVSSSVSIATIESGLMELQGLASIVPPPIISGEPIVTVGVSSAIINWTTDEEANALVSYAPENYYLKNDKYSQTVGDPMEYVSGAHQITISGLEPETIYHYQISSQKQVGSTAQSRDFVFRTIAELAEVESYTAEVLSNEEVSFKWTTTVPTDSRVRYMPYRNGEINIDEARTQKNDIYTTIHEITVSDMEAGVLYQIELSGATTEDNVVTQTIPSFATSNDNLAPIIKQVKTDAALSVGKDTKVQAIISWYTNEPATSRVYYEEGAGRSDEELSQSTPFDDNYARQHVVVITQFDPGSIYRFQVESIDNEGNVSRSRTYTILTPKQKESVFQVIMRNVEETFGWIQEFR